MFVAFDANLNRAVKASEAKASGWSSHVYICTNKDCQARLIFRNGAVKQPHFAHPAALTDVQRACITETNAHSINDESEWKKGWAERFDADSLERMVRLEKDYKRADVLFDDSRTVLQIQHSPLKSAEFAERNSFFHRAGYRSVWLIDANGWQDKGYLRKISLGELSQQQMAIAKEKGQYNFTFSRFKEVFGDYDPEIDLNEIVFVAFTDKTSGKEYIYRMDWVSPRAQEKFSATYYRDERFFSFLRSGSPLAEYELAASRKEVLKKRAEKAKKQEEEARRREEERQAALQAALEAERKQREAEENLRRIRAEEEERQCQETARKAQEAFAKKNADTLSAIETYLIKNGIMGHDNDPASMSREIISAAATDAGIELTSDERIKLSGQYVDFVVKGEKATREFLTKLPAMVFDLPYDQFFCYIVNNKPQDMILIERELFLAHSWHKKPVRPVVQAYTTTSTTKICKKCGKPLVQKTNSKTGELFWGCLDRACWSK